MGSRISGSNKAFTGTARRLTGGTESSMADHRTIGGDTATDGESDRYDALFGRIPLKPEPSHPVSAEESDKGFWLRLAENESTEYVHTHDEPSHCP